MLSAAGEKCTPVAVLDIEEVNIDISEPIDTPSLSSSALDRTMQPRKPKWEKRLPK